MLWKLTDYKQALTGYNGIPGLRKLVKGFEKSDGYDIRNIKNWTPNQKRRVRRWYNKIRELESQPRVYVKLNNKNRKKIIKAAHPGFGTRSLKYGLVPSVPGATGSASVVDDVIITKGKEFDRLFTPIDQSALIADHNSEIARCVAKLKGCRVFYVQADAFLIAKGFDAKALAGYVGLLINRYNGVDPILTGRHKGDAPDLHTWNRWLVGVVGFRIKTGISDIEAQRRTVAAMNEAKKKRRKKL